MMLPNQHDYRHFRISAMTIILFINIIFISRCNKVSDEQPFLSIPGFRIKCLFTEDFAKSSSQWRMDGTGYVKNLSDSGLLIQPITDSLGIIIWLKKNFENDYQLEYHLEFLDTAGTHLLFISAAGLNGEDLFHNQKSSTGNYQTYSNSAIRNYQFSMHVYGIDGQHQPQSRLRKNPGNIMLSYINNDPCQAHRKYTIDFIKIGNRLQLFVDGIRCHDYKDKDDRSRLYESGKIGFWFNGQRENFSVKLSHIRVFKLIPN